MRGCWAVGYRVDRFVERSQKKAAATQRELEKKAGKAQKKVERSAKDVSGAAQKKLAAQQG